MLFVLFICTELFNAWIFLAWPLQMHMLTGIFCSATNESELKVEFENPSDEKPKKIKRKLKFIIAFILLMIFNLSGSLIGAVFLNATAEAGATWSEIDVMRSKDGVCIVSHDATFKRLTDVSKKPAEMTWEEIKQLKVKDEFNPERPAGSISDLNSFMDASKGKIGLLIELKSHDIDKKTADDVVQIIYSKQMIDETMIISLYYDIIKYIEENYPEINTGYLYFFAIGDTSKINTDCLLMEESAVNPDIIEKIHNDGKTAFAWTVNNPDAINGLLNADVDGIITDHVVELTESVKKWDNKTDKDVILDEIKNILSNNQ